MKALSMVIYTTDKDDIRGYQDFILDDTIKKYGNRVLISKDDDLKSVLRKLAESLEDCIGD